MDLRNPCKNLFLTFEMLLTACPTRGDGCVLSRTDSDGKCIIRFGLILGATGKMSPNMRAFFIGIKPVMPAPVDITNS